MNLGLAHVMLYRHPKPITTRKRIHSTHIDRTTKKLKIRSLNWTMLIPSTLDEWRNGESNPRPLLDSALLKREIELVLKKRYTTKPYPHLVNSFGSIWIYISLREDGSIFVAIVENLLDAKISQPKLDPLFWGSKVQTVRWETSKGISERSYRDSVELYAPHQMGRMKEKIFTVLLLLFRLRKQLRF